MNMYHHQLVLYHGMTQYSLKPLKDSALKYLMHMQ
jgi:hypothetical protein